MSSATRAAQLSAQDEDSLLSLQADFEARNLSPSAALARKTGDGEIEKRGGQEEEEEPMSTTSASSSASAASQAAENPEPATTLQPLQQQQREQPAAPRQEQQQQQPFELVGKVVERRRAGSSNASTSTSTATAGGFPAATHRRQSKFSLARKAASSSSSSAATPPRPFLFPPPPPPSQSTAANPLKTDSGDASAMLSSMSPEELAEAKAEAEARLPAAAVEFLRRRGLEKQKKKKAAAAEAAAVAPPSLGALGLNSTGAPCFLPPSLAKEKKKTKEKKTDEEATPEEAKPSPPPASSRLRFDFNSACPVLPLAAEEDNPEDALSRDPLRSERKEVAEENAYTLAEAAALSRSAVPAQRLAAVDLMARIVSKVVVMVTMMMKEGGGSEDQRVFRSDDDSSTSSSSPLPPPLHLSITWGQVRQSLLKTVPLALRHALGDGHPAVVAAAARGLALLVDEGGRGRREGEREEEEDETSFAAALAASSIFPLTSSPALASAPATRPHAVGAWVRQGVVGDDDEDDDDGEEGDATSAAVAADLISGLLLRQTPAPAGSLLLERVSSVLAARSSHQAFRAATLPLIKLLRAAAAAGGEAAAAVAASRSAVAALVDVASAGEGREGEEEVNSSSWSSVRARAAAFDAISLLCASSAAAAGDVGSGGETDKRASSSAAAAALAAAGVGGVVSSTLLVSAAAISSSSSSSSDRAVQNLLLLASSLRAWRALIGSGVPCVRLDDAFSTLRFLFVDDDEEEDKEEEEGAASSPSFLAASAEALAAAAAAIASKQDACCSRGGAAAVTAQVLPWATGKRALLLARSTFAASASAASLLTRLAAAWRLLAVAEGEKLLEAGKLQAALEEAEGAGEGGNKSDLELLIEGASRAAAKLFESGSLSTSSERAVSIASCELLAALVALYRSISAAEAPLPPCLSPRALTSRRSPLGRGAVALAAAAAAGGCCSSSPASADASAATDATSTSWTRSDATLHQARRHALQLMALVGFDDEGEEGEEGEEENNSYFPSLSVPLAVLQLAPPGTEATIALPALAAFLSPGSLTPLLARADKAVEGLLAGTPSPLAAVAGRFGRWERLTTTKGEEEESSKGVSVSAASVQAFSKSALADYSATWLGMMMAQEEEGEGEKKRAAAPLLQQPFRLADPAGSRLPLPSWGKSTFSTASSWVLADVCPRGVASAVEASEAVGRALTLSLALLLLEEEKSASSRPPPISPSLCAASVADLLLGGDSGVVRGDSEAWRNPRARWAVAALSEQVGRRRAAAVEEEERGAGTGGRSAADAAAPKVTPARATVWASTWASDTFGDALCGGLVAAAALLSSGSSSAAAPAAAVAAFDVLEESNALSSLPAWEAAAFVYTPSSSSSSFILPAQLASRAATALAAGRLDRAIEESRGGEERGEGEGDGSKGSEETPSSPSLALADAVSWLREQCLAVVAAEDSGISGSSNPSPADPAAAAAALRHFLAQSRPRHVAALLLLKNDDDLSTPTPALILKALRSASGGNEALESKFKEAEKKM